MASRARARSSKGTAASAPGRLAATLTIDGHVHHVDVDLTTFTFREDFEAKSSLAQLTVLTEDGRVVYTPDATMRVLVYAWVVLKRSHPEVTFDAVLNIPKADFALAAPGEDASPEA